MDAEPSALDRWASRLERSEVLRRHVVDEGSAVLRSREDDERASEDLQPSELAARAFGHAAVLSARAGDDAFLRLGFAEAAQHYRAALDTIEHQTSPHLLRRAEWLV